MQASSTSFSRAKGGETQSTLEPMQKALQGLLTPPPLFPFFLVKIVCSWLVVLS